MQYWRSNIAPQKRFKTLVQGSSIKLYRSFVLAVFFMVMVMAPPPGSAHHSGAMFDHSINLTLKGAVTEFQWTNPHVHILVSGALVNGPAEYGGDQPTDWVLELTSPGNLVRIGGWSQEALKPGDQVTIEFAPHRDKSQRLGAMHKLTIDSTGQVLSSVIRVEDAPDSK